MASLAYAKRTFPKDYIVYDANSSPNVYPSRDQFTIQKKKTKKEPPPAGLSDSCPGIINLRSEDVSQGLQVYYTHTPLSQCQFLPDNFDVLVQQFWGHIRDLAPARFDAYIEPTDSDELDAMGRYLWNIALCEAFAPVLHAAEIALKNSIHNSLSRAYGNTAWFDMPDFLEPGEFDRVWKARQDLARKHKLDTADHIIAELSFGFWTGLLSKRYEVRVARPVLKFGFPHIPQEHKSRTAISARFNKARDMRNRTSHLEPIWNFAGLRDVHRQTSEAVTWINPMFAGAIRCTDRFNEILNGGVAPFRSELEARFKVSEPAKQTPDDPLPSSEQRTE